MRFVLFFAFYLGQTFLINGMAYPQKITKANKELLLKFIDNYRSYPFIKSRSDKQLEQIITSSEYVLVHPEEIDLFWERIKKGFPKLVNKENSIQVFKDIIQKASEELKKRKAKKKQPPVVPATKNAPVIQKNQFKNSEAIQKKKVKTIVAEKNPIASQAGLIALKKVIKAEIEKDFLFLSSRSTHFLKTVLETIDKIAENETIITNLQNEFNIPLSRLSSIFEKIKEEIMDELEYVEAPGLEKTPAHQIELEPEIATPEEKIEANRLYIGLDVKTHNSSGEYIRWQDTIDLFSRQLKENVKFIPNDYFHLTLAWIESKNTFDADTISRIEKMLSHASSILKIVFPVGVSVGLLDHALLMGDKKASVVFAVAESGDLKKLQDIIIQFLLFENIKGIKFNTFDKENALHVTLGKICPNKGASGYQKIAYALNAPEGARHSLHQNFTINTFRLTYSVAGKAWQEKASYKF